MPKDPIEFFDSEMAKVYDQRNQNLAPIKNSLFFLIELVLKNLPKDAIILSVGAGTGAEILWLAEKFPTWKFVALEPSKAMLDVCQERAKEAGIYNRCSFVHGHTTDLPNHESFHAALALFVAHFVPTNEKLSFFESMTSRIKKGGYVVNASISYDFDSREFPYMLENWKNVQRLMGADQASLEKIPDQLKNVLQIVSPQKEWQLLKQSGLPTPIQFFQAFMINAWYGIKK